MNPKLEKLFADLESDRIRLFEILGSLNDAKLRHKPSSDKWSIHQIVAHLFTSEKLSLTYMKKKSLGIETFKNSGVLESGKLILLILSQRLPFRYKAPKTVIQYTPDDLSITAIENEWSKVRLELREFVSTIDDRYLKKMIYKHPKAGMLNVVQAVTFFREHYIHHLPQIMKLVKS